MIKKKNTSSLKRTSVIMKKVTMNNSTFKGNNAFGRHDYKYVGVYPMMPRGYTAEEREELRDFERKIMGNTEVKI